MKTSQDILGQSLHDTFVSVLMKVRSLNMQLSDMYVRLDNKNEASLIIYDDNDNILYTAQLNEWEEWSANVTAEEAEEQFIALLSDIVNGDTLFELFNETEYNGPFSLLYVDEQMNVLAELLTIDKEN
ncbi:MAG: hypothetical protein IKK16_02710, partial [Bacteroidaceae bacterium]|nr:hypothetical protein [Bacteroidaceae bacterium]